MSIEDYVYYEQTLQQGILTEYKKVLNKLPEGGLSSYCINGKIYYKLTSNEQFGKESKYLGTADNKIVKQLQTRHFFKSSIKILEENLRALNYMDRHYKSYNPNEIEKNLKRAYKCLPKECFEIAGFIDKKGWGSQPYEKSFNHPENLKHMTSKGDLVRSKSELAIADMLFNRRLEYRYEQILHIGDTILVPDFSILSQITGEVVYHEHAGMTFDDEYINNFNWKLMKYRENGVVPWKNLIITYDDENGNLDVRAISKLYDIWFSK